MRGGDDTSRTAARIRTVLVDAAGSRRAIRRDRDPTAWSLAAGSLAVLLLLIGAGGLVGARLAERQALIDAGRFTELLGRTFVDPVTAQGLIDGAPTASGQMDAMVVQRLLVNTSVRRVKVWSARGVVLYSDEDREIGRHFAFDDGKLAVLHSSGPTASVSDLTDAEDVDERVLGDRLIEVYTSIRSSSGRPLLFEVYLSYDRLRDQRAAVFHTLGALAAVALIALTAVQLSLGVGHLRWLRRRHRAIDSQARAGAERDRQLLARNLHDGVIQELVGSGFVLDGAASALSAGNSHEAEALVASAAAELRSSVRSLRSVIVDLYPRSIHQGGLVEAVQDLVQPLRARGVEVAVRAVDLPLERDEDRAIAEVVHRCAQELIRNVVRHADASYVEILVESTPDRVTLTVRDDGRGFDPGQLKGAGDHLGLRALADIARERQGTVQISSAPGLGTEVTMGLHR